jgi:membrane-associated phospholipid phosphatase
MTRPRIAAAGTALSLWLTSAPTVAQTGASTHELRWGPALDVTVTAGGLAVWIASEVLNGDIAPSTCRWCSLDPPDARVRDALIWRDPALADTLSNVTGIVLMPLSAIGLDTLAAAHDGTLRSVPEDALLIAEAAVVAADVNQLVKLVVGRERPFVHALPPEQKSLTSHPSDNNLSFFSGHSTEAFALAAASGTVGTMRGYRWAPLAWSVGGAMAATTAYLRIAADKHWLTDVVVGAVVGAGIGFAVPYFFHSAVDDPPRIQASAAVRADAMPIRTALTIAW